MSKKTIRISIKEPLTIRCLPVCNMNGIDEFIERFVREDTLIINEYRLPIHSFVKHDERTATFDGMNWFDFGEITLALAQEIGLHNIRVNAISDN